MSIVEERLEVALSELRSLEPSLSGVALSERIVRRREGVRSLRMRVALGSSVAAVVAAGAAVTLAPAPAMASLREVVQLTEQVPYEHITDDWLETAGDKEEESHKVEWKLPDRWVVSNSFQLLRHSWEPKVKLQDTPLYQETVWIYSDGRRVTWNPSCRKAVITKGAPYQPSQPVPSLDDIQKAGKVVQTRRAVHVHGGAYDEYSVNVELGEEGTMHYDVYADPSSHRVRFLDWPMQEHKHPDQDVDADGHFTGIVFGKRPNDRIRVMEEFRFPSPAELARLAPKQPRAIPSAEEKTRFLSEISTPVGSQIVAGIKKTLFGVVVRGDGQVLAITQGGAPENELDAHDIKIEGAPWRRWRDVPPIVGGVELAGREPVVLPQQIGRSKYLIESTRLAITGPVPRWLTLKVPVWKLDKSHPLTTASGQTYRSMFVGYATFSTSKIFTMPQGLNPVHIGELLPSRY